MCRSLLANRASNHWDGFGIGPDLLVFLWVGRIEVTGALGERVEAHGCADSIIEGAGWGTARRVAAN